MLKGLKSKKRQRKIYERDKFSNTCDNNYYVHGVLSLVVQFRGSVAEKPKTIKALPVILFANHKHLDRCDNNFLTMKIEMLIECGSEYI